MSAIDSMDVQVTMQCNCCGNREAERFVAREDGYVCKCCGQWFRFQTNAEKSRCSQGYEDLSNYKFDDARNIFQMVLIDNPGSVSARWGLLLSRFGIVFTKAFAGKKPQPLYCFAEYGAMKGKRFSSECEYEEIIKLIGDDEELIYFYKSKAKEIDGAIEKIQENGSSAASDVFICVQKDMATDRHPDFSGETEDFAKAKEIYNDLCSHGVDVFLAPVSLGTSERSDAEIWPRLVKSKKMLLIASKEEYIESIWTKSEWRRWNRLGRKSELYVMVLKHENESPKAVLPHELLENESQIYTLDTYDRMLCDVSADDSYVLEGQENGRIVTKDGREQRIRYGTVEIGAGEFKGRTDIVSVSLPLTVVNIGNGAFCGCTALSSLTMREGLRNIEESAFEGCVKLGEAAIPSTVTKIGNRAFAGCGAMLSAALPTGLTFIGEGAFSGCNGLSSVRIPETVNYIGMGAFGLCRNLHTVTVASGNVNYKSTGNCIIDSEGALIAGCVGSVIPQDGSIRSIGKSAFAGCVGITNAIIPEGTKAIGESAFAGCNDLASISIPESVCDIGSYAFGFCPNIRRITVADGNSRYSGANSCLINKQNKILALGCAGSVIPRDGSVEIIGAGAFAGNAELTDIVIPEGVEIIENEAFKYCRNLKTVSLPKSLISVGEDAFYECKSLVRVTYAGARDMWAKIHISGGNTLLAKAYGVEVKGATGYGSYSFGGAGSYGSEYGEQDEIELPGFKNSVLGGKADFSAGKSNGKIICTGGMQEIIVYGTREIKDGAYSGRTDIISVELPETVRTIGRNAFRGCTRMESISVPESVTSIGNVAFGGCSKLAEIKLPDGLEKLGDGAFGTCISLKSIEIPGKIKNIGSQTFTGCSALASVTLGESIEEIGERAFAECASFKNIYYSGAQAQWKTVKIGAGNPKIGGFLAKVKVNFI